ncbi:MAG: ATP-dependent RNA helicase [Lentisphaerae bacterium]|jgi:ATP-dependent helicase HrpB|nr:ATP-dependent RNA helicase [Lentisphaerota bacterium]
MLPIHAIRQELAAALRRSRRIVLTAPTGSGKSTQIPQMLLDLGSLDSGKAVVLQPRRLATRLLAKRVAEERGTLLGDEVGYQIRLESVCGPRTRIHFETEGILLRQMLSQPGLPDVAAILFDEFHERHVYGDVTLAQALRLQQTARPDLLLIVMSATLDTRHLLSYLDALRHTPAAKGALLLPLHGELPPAEQDAAVAQYGQPKIIVATNVAETSLTIQGIRLVIDSGLARVARFDPWRGINTLHIERISRASADQRAGRAGRTAPGRAVRLWTEREHAERALHDLPEIKRVDPAEILLTLKALGVDAVAKFPWLEPPEPRALERALLLLRDLGALDAAGAPTPLGRRMLSFPLHPRYSRMLLDAARRGAVRPVALAAAIAQGRPILIRKVDKATLERRNDLLGTPPSDLFLLLRAWRYAHQHHYNLERCRHLGIHAAAARQVGPLWNQFLQIAQAQKLPIETSPPDDDEIAKCVLAGFSDQVARRLDRGTLRCQLVHGRRGELARESVVHDAELLVANEINEIGRGDGETHVLLTQATAIRAEWLRELYPDDFAGRIAVEWDAAAKRVIARREMVFRDLPLETHPLEAPPPEEAALLLARAVLDGQCVLKHWNHAVDQWIARVNLLAAACPDWGLPAYGPAERELLIQQLCHGAASCKEIRDRPVLPTVKSLLSPAQIAVVEQHMPERVTLSNGRSLKAQYADAAEPYISARIQELFDVHTLPALAGGRLPLVIHILAPSHRPVQITKDLPNFWSDHYPRIKQELRRKYPKHEWR